MRTTIRHLENKGFDICVWISQFLISKLYRLYISLKLDTHTWENSHDGSLLARPKRLVAKVTKGLVDLRRNLYIKKKKDMIYSTASLSLMSYCTSVVLVCLSARWEGVYPALCCPLGDCTEAPWVEEERDARSPVLCLAGFPLPCRLLSRLPRLELSRARL